jgi:hypothetical protein
MIILIINCSRKKEKPKKKQSSPYYKGKIRLSGREGSPHEEEYLVITMRSYVPSAKRLGTRSLSLLFLSNVVGLLVSVCLTPAEDIRSLLTALLFFGCMDKATMLQSQLSSFIDLVNSASQLLSAASSQSAPSTLATASTAFSPSSSLSTPKMEQLVPAVRWQLYLPGDLERK